MDTSKDLAAQNLIAKIIEAVGTDLMKSEQIFAEELHTDQPVIRDIHEHVSRFRGKRIRPTLLLLTADACGGINHSHHVLAAVVEMIHTATLVHDDVLDDANTRRHVATVNSRWNTETSVLFGDYLFTHSFHLASSLESTYACRQIGRSTNIVCEGELTQISERGNIDLTEERYFEIINGKTAELCAVSCSLGAYYSECTEEEIAALEQFGRDLGCAFQIADDILDIMGEETQAGKSLGSDFYKQKMTLPLIRLLQMAEPADEEIIRGLLASPSAENWEKLTPYLQEYRAIESARQTASEYATSARANLAKLPDSNSRTILEELTEFAIQRSH
ncbi:Octaprenyl-diphosphate synthase [Polystyrenella longa]|uniref:Octaprenyl-diphosphate synthase n=1 Tax=Polystyrenella longa TaxID=2528007 RepID=A0A518CJB9_9PLAN|nr:polyprenyl synthetase family protein [Polystyrenella longa]QDU79284.1 Octaprenyl-diphosphate synthase [Polystyrenella longa]